MKNDLLTYNQLSSFQIQHRHPTLIKLFIDLNDASESLVHADQDHSVAIDLAVERGEAGHF